MTAQFKLQKPNVYNKHLPYDTREEAIAYLASIKYNLSRAVILKELIPGVYRWIAVLKHYINLYGLYFSKEDHIMFIKLCFDLMTSPNMDSMLVKDSAELFIELMKYKRLLTREDLQLPWRPLFKLLTDIGNKMRKAFVIQPDYHHGTIQGAIRRARCYFSVESTAEILMEYRPFLCPFDDKRGEGTMNLEIFLPTRIPQEHKDQAYMLWFDELINYWFTFAENDTMLFNDLLKLFTRLAAHNVGHIDWSPYVPKLFDYLRVNLQLPLSYRLDCVEASGFAKLFVYMMGGENGHVVMDHLERLFIALKSFFHPSNEDDHSQALLEMLETLVKKFTIRLSKERYRRTTWTNNIPMHVRITDDEIERFVLIVREVAFLAMYGKSEMDNVNSIMQNLALIRADLILPTLLERTLEALETLVETHQVTATLSCMTFVSRAMVTGGDGRMPTAPTQVIPLLRVVLPGIDTNDLEKTTCVLKLIAAIVSLVPLVNCTDALTSGIELTEIEKELCLQSAQFEEIVLLLFDRLFTLVENSTSERIGNDCENNTSTDETEESIKSWLLVVTEIVINQCSKEIFQSVLDRLFSFITSHVLEVDYAGCIISSICWGMVLTRPEISLKKMLPFILSTVKNLVEVEGVKEDENVQPELLWYMELLARIVSGHALFILPYKNSIQDILRILLHMTNKRLYIRGSLVLSETLTRLTQVYVYETMYDHEGLDKSPAEHVYVRDWGKPGKINNLNVRWHIPNAEEIEFANELLQEFLIPQFEILKKLQTKEVSMTRDELHRHIYITKCSVRSLDYILPLCKGEEIEDFDKYKLPSLINIENRLIRVMPEEMNDLKLCITREEVIKDIHKLLEFLLSEHPDDTKSFTYIIEIYQHMYGKSEFFRNYFNVESLIKDLLHSKNTKLRPQLIDYVEQQHEKRLSTHQLTSFTRINKLIADDLVVLATSQYTEVRMNAQDVLMYFTAYWGSCSRYIIPQLMHNIRKEETISHEKLKGTLYILLNSCIMYNITKLWDVICDTWVTIAKTIQSEQPSIIALIENVITEIKTFYCTLQFHNEVDQKCVDSAMQILLSECPAASFHGKDDTEMIPTAELITKSEKILKKKEEDARRYFRTVEKELCDCLNDPSTHWRAAKMCCKLLKLLRNHEEKYSAYAVETSTNMLVNDLQVLRKKGLVLTTYIMFQNAIKYPRVKFDYQSIGINPTHDVLISLKPGDNRPDNEMIQYAEVEPITCQDDLDRYNFIDKNYWGFHTWPKQLEVYKHSCDFYATMRSKEKLSECETIILSRFTNSDFLGKFIKYFSMEVNQFSTDDEELAQYMGSDGSTNQFQNNHFVLFKFLFKNYGPQLLNVFRDVITELVSEKNPNKNTLAAEMISGMIRGSKYWNFADLKDLWDFLLPLFQDVFDSKLMEETLCNWRCSLYHATVDHHPDRYWRLFEWLTENPLSEKGGAQGDAFRVSVVSFVFMQQHSWRVSRKNESVLQYILPRLAHHYQNVRQEIGLLVVIAIRTNIQTDSYTPSRSPSLKVFTDYVIPILKQNIADSLDEEMKELSLESRDSNNNNKENEKKTERDNFLKTVLQALYQIVVNFQSSIFTKELYDVIKLVLPSIAREDDQDLAGLCSVVLNEAAKILIPEELIPHAFTSVIELCTHRSWKARLTALTGLQVMIANNFFKMNKESIKADLKSTLIARLEDKQLEVRETASSILSGFIHSRYISVTEDLLNTFYTMAKKEKKKSNALTMKKGLNIEKRHGGVLGLSASVLAFPYDVEDWMPDVLIKMEKYLHDDPIIMCTTKKTLLDFQRTHRDNWHIHRQKFTELQLEILNDLLIGPSYYA